MKIREILQKTKQFSKKLGAKTLLAICAVLVLGSVVLLHVLVQKEAGTPETGGRLAVDLTKSPQESVLSSAQTAPGEEDYFAAMSLQRKQARDEAMEVLLSVSESETALEEAKQAALTDMNQMALQMEQEANIETLVQSKGFTPCVAVVQADKCSVIVESGGLLPGDVAQISEIVYEQAGILPENLKIIEKTAAD